VKALFRQPNEAPLVAPARARFECARDRWVEVHGYLSHTNAITCADLARQQGDGEVCLLFYECALKMLTRTVEGVRERERRGWDGVVPLYHELHFQCREHCARVGLNDPQGPMPPGSP
jgi:hypothetical protein